MNEEKIKQIEREAEERYPWVAFPREVGYHENDVAEKCQYAYEAGATTEANKALPLLEALKKIDAMSFHKNEWKEMAEIGEIAKQAITNYKNHP